MFASARKAAELIFDRAFFHIVLKAVALTILLFVIVFAGAEYALYHLPIAHSAGLDAALPILGIVVFILLVMFLGAPVAALFATLFLEDVARAVEAKDYPDDPLARGAPFWQGLLLGLRLFALLVAANALLLPGDFLLPGVGNLLSLFVTGWLLGRQYFELVALRHISRTAMDNLRRQRRGAILAAGVILAVAAAIPVVNLFAPLFGVALMVHEYKRFIREDQPA
jgi:CysZ protein